MSETLDYYEKNANEFIENTRNVNMHVIQDRFLDLLPSNCIILDFGCGSGRDTKYFVENGIQVEAVDGAKRICEYARKYTGIRVNQMRFQDLKAMNRYDGIWACSSILHLPKSELLPVIRKMCDSLKKNGIIYTSFKYGNYEGKRNERYFTDFTKETFMAFIEEISELMIEDYWITSDVRPGRNDEKWLNLILRKLDIC